MHASTGKEFGSFFGFFFGFIRCHTGKSCIHSKTFQMSSQPPRTSSSPEMKLLLSLGASMMTLYVSYDKVIVKLKALANRPHYRGYQIYIKLHE
jgi:hypothetical protein